MSKTVGGRVRQLLTGKRAMTYRAIAQKVRREMHSHTTPDAVAWYASRLRAEGVSPNVLLGV